MPYPDITTKVCSQCHLEKPVNEFHKHKREKDGYRRNCKQCRADNGECNYVKPAPDGFQWCRKCDTLYPATLEYFYWNKTQNKLQASCKSCHYLRTRSWQKRNYEFWMGRNRQWMIAHPDKMKASMKKWQDANPEVYKAIKIKSLADLHQYEIDNPDWAKANAKRGKAQRRKMETQAEGSHTSQDILQMFEDQNELCAYCGIRLFWNIKGDIHLEHIEPLSRGGSNNPDNLCLSCADCNLSKGNKTLAEWQLTRGW